MLGLLIWPADFVVSLLDGFDKMIIARILKTLGIYLNIHGGIGSLLNYLQALHLES